MPRYFFNIRRHGVLIPDPDGDDLPDVDAAGRLGLEILAEMARLPHVYGEMREWQRDEFAITDENGATVLILPFATDHGEA